MALMRLIGAVVLVFACLVTPPAAAEDVALVYSTSGKFDKGFLESAFLGILKARRERDISVIEVIRHQDETQEYAVVKAAEQADMIMVVGFPYTDVVASVAPTLPGKSFTIIDSVVVASNVRSVIFREHEGAFLVGALAARHTRTGTVGFLGGMDVPVIRRFEAGFRQGVAYEDQFVKVLSSFIGQDVSGFINPYGGYRAAIGMVDREADILFAAAGASGLGVYQAAADRNVYAIGVDTSQNYLHPGVMLTSMLKRVDLAVYGSLIDWSKGSWKPGVVSLGVKEGGVGYADDRFNAQLMSDEARQHLDLLAAQIADGDILVRDVLKPN